MSFGSQTMTFIVDTPTGLPGKLGTRRMVPTLVDVPGCRFRPLSTEEAADAVTNAATTIWKGTAPPESAAIAAKSTGRVQVDGVTYDIIGGAKPFEDIVAPFKVTILCQVHNA